MCIDHRPPPIELPQDLYESVLGLAIALTNTRLQDDVQAQSRAYAALQDFCESAAVSERDHPFLWDTLADFTIDDRLAIALYQRSLATAAQLGSNDVDGTTHFALALRYHDVGDSDLAYKHAMAADEIAKRLDDLSLRRDISRFLLDRSQLPKAPKHS